MYLCYMFIKCSKVNKMFNFDFFRYGFNSKETILDWLFSVDSVQTLSIGAIMASFVDIVFGVPPLAILILFIALCVELITDVVACRSSKSCKTSTTILRWGLKVIIYFTSIGLFHVFSNVWEGVWCKIYTILHQAIIWYFIFATIKRSFENFEIITGEEVAFLKFFKNIHRKITKQKK